MAETAHLRPADSLRKNWRLILPFGLLYALYGTVLGFMQGGAGPVLLSRGLPLDYAGFVAALFLPIGLAFLWAPLLERRTIRGLPDHSGWIIIALVILAGLFVCIAFAPNARPFLLLLFGLAATTTLATMDLQLEALVVRLVSEELRPAAAALKIGLFSLGAVAGGGALVALFEGLGWRNVFLGFALLSLVPLIAVPLVPRPSLPSSAASISLKALFKRGEFLCRLAASAALLSSCFLLFGLIRVALVDLGVSLQEVGWIAGALGSIAGLPMLILIPILALKYSRRTVFLALLSAGLLVGLACAFASASGKPELLLAVSVPSTAILAGIYVLFLSTLLTWSDGDMPATTYAAFYALANLVALIPMVLAGALAAAVGWPTYFIGASAAFLVAGLAFRGLLSTDEAHRAT